MDRKNIVKPTVNLTCNLKMLVFKPMFIIFSTSIVNLKNPYYHDLWSIGGKQPVIYIKGHQNVCLVLLQFIYYARLTALVTVTVTSYS